MQPCHFWCLFQIFRKKCWWCTTPRTPRMVQINRKKSTNKFFNLYENIFLYFYPCQFKVQNTTGVNHNKGRLLKQQSGFCFGVVRILRYSRLFSQPTIKKCFPINNLSNQHNEVEGYPIGLHGLSCFDFGAIDLLLKAC